MQAIVNVLSDIWTWFQNIVDFLSSLLSFLISILWFIWYAWKTLLVWVYKLIVYVFEWWVFVNVARAFDFIADYIWTPWAIFVSALLFVIIVRIIIAFVLKIFKLDIDYHKDINVMDVYHKHDSLKH